MKKCRLCMYLMIFMLLISCDKKEQSVNVSEEDKYYAYPITEVIYSYDVNEERTLYYLTATGEGDSKKYLVRAIGSKGEVLHTYDLSDVPDIITVGEQVIYYCVSKESGTELYTYSVENQTSELIHTFPSDTLIEQMDVINGCLIFLGTNEDKNQLVIMDESGTVKELEVAAPISFSKTLDGNIVIYAYDDSEGYYFTKYHLKNQSFSDNIRNAIEFKDQFAIYNDTNDYVYLKAEDTMRLVSGTLSEGKGEIEMIPNLVYAKDVICQGNYTYMIVYNREEGQDILDNRIVRIHTKSYLKGKETIHIISTEFYESYVPFGCGYRIEQDQKSEEEFAISILSGDKNYDLCFLSTEQTTSQNIRKQGSFYPLNHVDGVKEYLDACFPYLKSAATNEDGEVWMLPIAVNLPIFFYNEELCKNYDLNFTKEMTYDEFLSILGRFQKDTELTDLYCYNQSAILSDFFRQYLRENKDFSSDMFKQTATLLHASMKQTEYMFLGNMGLFLEFNSNDMKDFLMLEIDDTISQLNAVGKSNMNQILAFRIPPLTQKKEGVASCFFICVNPQSKHLEEVLNYITSFCNYQKARNDILLFQERGCYPEGRLMDEIYEIYSNGEVQFTYPEELFMEDFETYLNDNMDLDTMIKNSNQRMSTFLNE